MPFCPKPPSHTRALNHTLKLKGKVWFDPRGGSRLELQSPWEHNTDTKVAGTCRGSDGELFAYSCRTAHSSFAWCRTWHNRKPNPVPESSVYMATERCTGIANLALRETFWRQLLAPEMQQLVYVGAPALRSKKPKLTRYLKKTSVEWTHKELYFQPSELIKRRVLEKRKHLCKRPKWNTYRKQLPYVK